jgi:hypothetical protein
MNTKTPAPAYKMPSTEQLLTMEMQVARAVYVERWNKQRTKLIGIKLTLWKGLYCFLTPGGVKSFRFPYIGTKPDGSEGEKLYTMENYHPSAFNVGQALAEHARLREVLARPGAKCIGAVKVERKKGEAILFKTEADSWLAANRKNLATKTADNYASLIKRYLAPLHAERLGDITPPMCLNACQVPAGAGHAKTARTLARIIREVYARAIANGPYSGGNPAAETIDQIPKGQKRNLPALRVPMLPQFFSDLTYFETEGIISEQVAIGIELQMHLGVRSSILHSALWNWIDMHAPDGPVLIVPPFTPGLKQHTTARNEEHEGAAYVSYYVPLSAPVLALLDRQRVLAKGSRFIFPALDNTDGQMSVRTLLQTVHLCLGWDGEIENKASPYYRPKITMHGMRCLFSTGMRDKKLRAAAGMGPLTLEEAEAIELCMDHKVRTVDAAPEVMDSYYRGEGDSHRTLRLGERHGVMHAWSAILVAQKASAPVRTLPANPHRAAVVQSRERYERVKATRCEARA